MSELMSLDLILIAACIWLAIGLVGVSQPHNFRLISRVLFPLGAFITLLVAGIALAHIAADPQFRVLPLGLPDLPFHLRLDALSSFFLFLLGDGGVSFASQYDQIMQHPWAAGLSASPDALGLYLRLGYIPAPYALLEQSHMLPAGAWLSVAADGRIVQGT